jgi:outer membrane protein TolC
MKELFYILFAAITLSGCSAQRIINENSAEMSDDWRNVFTDKPLQRLIDSALQHNADVLTVRQNIEQASWQMRSAGLCYLPSFVFAPSATWQKAQSQPAVKTYELPITMQWEMHLGGENKAKKSSAKYLYFSAQQQLVFTQRKLIAEIANAYYTLLMIDRQLQLTTESIALQQQTLDAIRELKEIGKMNELAVNQAEALLYETVASESALKLQQQKTIIALSLLSGQNFEHVERSEFNNAGLINIDTSAVDLQSLASRPDVLTAEYNLRIAANNTRAAKSQFYPTLQINATGAWTNNLGEIVNPGKMLLTLVGSLTQPLFQQGRIKAEYKIVQSQENQAQIAFSQALLQAGCEVAEALSECKFSSQKIQNREAQTSSALKAFENSRLLMQYSQSVGYLEVLTAQSTYLNALLQSSADELEAQQAKINLYKALCR